MSRSLVCCMICLLSLAGARWSMGADLTVGGANLLRLDEGFEVDPQKSAEYPENRSRRSFFENRLRMNIGYGHLSFGGRLLYFRPSEIDRKFFGVESETELDKRYLEAQVSPLAIRVGHFAQVFDYGLALSLLEERDIFFDSELDGVRFSFAKGPVSFAALKGRSRARPGFLVAEEGVTGIHGEVAPAPGWKMGASFVHLDSSGYPESRLPAVSAAASLGPVQLGGEFAWKETDVGSEQVQGHAGYVETMVTAGSYTLFADYKDYRYRGWTPFQNPPLVSREIGPRLLQNREPHVFYPEDDVGYQVELSGMVTEELFARIHFNHSSHHAAGQKGIARPTFQERNWPYWEFFADAEMTWPSQWRLEFEVGLNEEAQLQYWYKKHWLAADGAAPLGEAGSLLFGAEVLGVRDERTEENFTDALLMLGWDDGKRFSLEVQSQWTDDESLRKKEGISWPSAEAAYSFGEGRHHAILFYGRERGGLRCSNGFCRRVQPFEGFRFILESSL
ncbi:MAG: DUF6029 family protein [bacterium]